MNEKFKSVAKKIIFCVLVVSICLNILFTVVIFRGHSAYAAAGASIKQLEGQISSIADTVGAAGKDYTAVESRLKELGETYSGIRAAESGIKETSGKLEESNSKSGETIGRLGESIQGSSKSIDECEQYNISAQSSIGDAIKDIDSIIGGADKGSEQ